MNTTNDWSREAHLFQSSQYEEALQPTYTPKVISTQAVRSPRPNVRLNLPGQIARQLGAELEQERAANEALAPMTQAWWARLARWRRGQ